MSDPVVPTRVQVALQFVERCQNITDPGAFCGCRESAGRDLVPGEKAAFEASLTTIRLFVSGEMDYADARPQEDAADKPSAADNPPSAPARLGRASRFLRWLRHMHRRRS